ncbi:hypothetical protein SUGI_0802470 [Cryptomeria japonica]|nr:hypothetical protein SUGI_0802470 [Cryptomeria japonica]
MSVVNEDDKLWLSGVNALSEALKEFQEESGNNMTIISRTTTLSFGSSQDQIWETLVELNNTSGVRAFIVHTSVQMAVNMFSIGQELDMMNETYIWLVTDSIASFFNSLPSSTMQILQGIVGVIKIRYGEQISKIDTNPLASMMDLTGGDLLHQEIVQAISGPVSDNLEICEYEIINVVENSYKRVGFWRKDTGRLQFARRDENKLVAIIWPGDTTQVPNGYIKLVFGKVIQNNASDYIDFIVLLYLHVFQESTYTNDIFQATVDTLPYNLPFVYEAFDKGNSNLSTYDAFVTELYDGNRFDAVLVFTSFFVFTAALWATSGALFVFTAFLVWLMEHKDNEEFQGGVTKQVVTSLTKSSLSAFVFSQREDVKSSLGKGIVAICLLSPLILNNSYTVHLTSILTVESWARTITNMKSLTTSNVQVGYLKTSFVKTYLTNDLKIHKDRLVPLESPCDYVMKLLSGEVGAIVDENPYLQIVKSLYPCEKLAIMDRGYFSSGGFGFIFREGSPFLSDISEAVLNISEHHYTVASIHRNDLGKEILPQI